MNAIAVQTVTLQIMPSYENIDDQEMEEVLL